MNDHIAAMANVIMNRKNKDKRTLIIEFSRNTNVKKPRDEETFYILYPPKK